MLIVTQDDLRGALQNAPLHQHIRQDVRAYFEPRLAGLMGQYEMECAVRRIVSLCVEDNQRLEQVRITREQFEADGFDRYGFDELKRFGYLHSFGESFFLGTALVARIRRRFPELSI